MKKYWLNIALIIGLLATQMSFMPLLSVYGVGPDLMLLMTVSYSFVKGSKIGGFIGLTVGLLTDIATGTYLGMYALSYTVLGLFFGIFSDHVYREQFLFPVIAALAATGINYCFCLTILHLLGNKFSFLGHILHTLPILLIFQLIFSYPIYWLVYKLDSKCITITH